MSPSHSVTGYGAPGQVVTVGVVLSAAEADPAGVTGPAVGWPHSLQLGTRSSRGHVSTSTARPNGNARRTQAGSADERGGLSVTQCGVVGTGVTQGAATTEPQLTCAKKADYVPK